VRFHQRPMGRPSTVGILAGSFNPPTVAHSELAEAAKLHLDTILLVVPSVLPHKQYFGATLAERLELLAAAGIASGCGIATTKKGLFIDIARECRAHYGAGVQLSFICGRDAAERVLGWDYGRPDAVREMLGEFELLVAARGGEFRPPAEFRDRIHSLTLRGDWDEVSSTEVRKRIALGEPWEHLVPEKIVDRVRKIYS